jgi:hypothetical protein
MAGNKADEAFVLLFLVFCCHCEVPFHILFKSKRQEQEKNSKCHLERELIFPPSLFHSLNSLATLEEAFGFFNFLSDELIHCSLIVKNIPERKFFLKIFKLLKSLSKVSPTRRKFNFEKKIRAR